MANNILDKIVQFYVDNNTSNLVGEETETIKAILSEKLYNDIKDEIIKSEETILHDKIKNLIEQERDKKRTLEMKNLLWEGFFLAFLMGILVNEVTMIIDVFKGVPVVNITVTLIIVLVFIMLTVLLYNFKYTKELIKKVVPKKGHKNQLIS